MLHSDLALSRRLELAEAGAGARFVEARASARPESGAGWIEVAGAYAMFDGPQSPATQTFCLGLFAMPAPADLDRIETFYCEHRAPVMHEVSPLADKALLPLLNSRGYRPLELTSVMFQTLPANIAAAAGVAAREITSGEHNLWARTAAEGWREKVEYGQLFDWMCTSTVVEKSHSFLAEIDGHPVAAGSVVIAGGVALLAGAATIPEWRNRGAQRALLAARLGAAAAAGCDLAMICAEPGSASQRNAERQGFRIAYTRIKWAKA